MGPDEFASLTDSDILPTILATTKGTVVAVNLAAREELDVAPGADLARIVAEPAERLAEYLRTCAGSRAPSVGALRIRYAGGERRARCIGGLAAPGTDAAPSLVVIRLAAAEQASRVFIDLSEQIDRLHADLYDRLMTQRKLEALLAEKQVLLREVHHRVKNNLQMIASMVRLSSRGATGAMPAVLTSITSRIGALGQVYEQIHRAEDMSRVDLGAYVDALTTQIADAFAFPAISVHKRLAPLVVGIDTAIPVGIAATEFITNAFKYAFEPDRPGALSVRLDRFQGRGRLTVRDDGAGLPDDEPGGGMGLKLVSALLAQIEGTLSRKTLPGGGAQFRLLFRLDADLRTPASAA